MAEAIHFSLLMIHTAKDLDRRRLPRAWLAFHLGTGLWLAFIRCGLTSLSWAAALLPGLFPGERSQHHRRSNGFRRSFRLPYRLAQLQDLLLLYGLLPE